MSLSLKLSQPPGDRVLVSPIDKNKDTVVDGIIIKREMNKKTKIFEVISLGTGKLDKKGNMIPFTVEVGDHVLISENQETSIFIESREYIIVASKEILAKVE